MHAKTVIRFISILLATPLLSSCIGNNYTYNDCKNIDKKGWHKDTAIVISPTIDDTASTYDITVTLRHTSEYNYQNFWMFMDITSPSGVVTKDTIECYLADNRGRFLGSGISIYEMPVLVKSGLKLNEVGSYSFAIRHGMRENQLSGIKNICLTIEKRDN